MASLRPLSRTRQPECAQHCWSRTNVASVGGSWPPAVHPARFPDSCTPVLDTLAQLQAAEADVAAEVETVRNDALRFGLECGVAFLQDTMKPEDRAVAERLFAAGAIQVRCCAGRAYVYSPHAMRLPARGSALWRQATDRVAVVWANAKGACEWLCHTQSCQTPLR